MIAVDTIFFDLDGTLINAMADIVNAMNYTLRTMGYNEKSSEEIVSYIGTGVSDLIAKSMSTRDVRLVRDGVPAEASIRLVEDAEEAIVAYKSSPAARKAMARAYARQATVTESNGVVSVNNQMPDSAQGDYLVRWLSLLGLSIRPAGGSAGNITLNNSVATVVSVGATLVDSTGLVFAVAVFVLVSYLAIARPDIQQPPEASAAATP